MVGSLRSNPLEAHNAEAEEFRQFFCVPGQRRTCAPL